MKRLIFAVLLVPTLAFAQPPQQPQPSSSEIQQLASLQTLAGYWQRESDLRAQIIALQEQIRALQAAAQKPAESAIPTPP